MNRLRLLLCSSCRMDLYVSESLVDINNDNTLFSLHSFDTVAEYCGNVEMCRLTEQVVFSDPYRESPFNRWTSPYLDDEAESIRRDNALKLEVAELKSKYNRTLLYILSF